MPVGGTKPSILDAKSVPRVCQETPSKLHETGAAAEDSNTWHSPRPVRVQLSSPDQLLPRDEALCWVGPQSGALLGA